MQDLQGRAAKLALLQTSSTDGVSAVQSSSDDSNLSEGHAHQSSAKTEESPDAQDHAAVSLSAMQDSFATRNI